VTLIDKERGPRPAPCPRCGGDAYWGFLDRANSRVAVSCPDCGQFEMSQTQFHQAISDIAELENRCDAPVK
jgi:transcription elongation factor Elf1